MDRLPDEIVRRILDACVCDDAPERTEAPCPAPTLIARRLCKRTRAMYPALTRPVDLTRPLPTWVVRLAAEHLHDSWSIMRALAASGVLENMQWLHDDPRFGMHRMRTLLSHSPISRMAARHGHVHVLRWLFAEGYPVAQLECTVAAEAGHLDVLKWMALEAFPDMFADLGYANDVTVDAAQRAHIHILDWLRTDVLKGDLDVDDICTGAVRGGHMTVLQWALDLHGLKVYLAQPCTEAAARGKLDMLRYLREHGCPWDARTLRAAQYRGGDVEAYVVANYA